MRVHFPLQLLLTRIGLARSVFFYHLKPKGDSNAELAQQIEAVYHQHQGNYGYRRITLALRKIFTINHKKVQRLMQTLGLKGKSNLRKYRSYQGQVGKIAENLLQQDFHATAPNQKWVTDITELKCAEGKVYFSPIKDLFNGEIIAYDVATCANVEQITRMMTQAIARLDGATPILHSVAISDGELSRIVSTKWYHTQYVEKGKLLG